MATVADFVAWLQALAPVETAAEWDNVGLLVGETTAPVRRAMTCLTVTPETVAEAVADDAQLIVSHHPMLFRATKRLTSATVEGRLLLELIRARIAVYSPHTAYDNCVGGINDQLAARLGLTNVAPLRAVPSRSCKIAVFVPDADLARVSDAMFAAGAGRIGQYRECSFRLAGTGTFFGSDEANPTVGQKGRREDVNEWRLEVVCPETAVDAVVKSLRSAHSYEEPAYDVYPLRPARGTSGEGRVGQLPHPTTLGDLAALVKDVLKAGGVGLVGERRRPVRRVALACGAAGEFLADAQRAGADVFLTGELRFHDALTAQAAGIGVVVPGHHATERLGVDELASKLAAAFADVSVWAIRSERDPLEWV